MKNPEPADCWVGNRGWPSRFFGAGRGEGAPSSSFSPAPGGPGWMLKGKFSNPGMRLSTLVSTRDVTLIDTTAGETCSKMSAKDIVEPGGGAKIGAVAALITGACWSAWALGSS